MNEETNVKVIDNTELKTVYEASSLNAYSLSFLIGQANAFGRDGKKIASVDFYPIDKNSKLEIIFHYEK